MKQKLQLTTLVLILVLGFAAMTLVTSSSLASGAGPLEQPTDHVAWITPDGMLYVQVERGTELLYFDSFNIAALYQVAQSPRLQWQDRWEFRRE